MNKEEYEDFALRYKGCGACFPMYHTLSRFEKMWFTAIQKDVAELEKENAELKDGIALKDEEVGCIETDFNTFKSKAKELLKRCYDNHIYLEPLRSEIAQFLSEVEK